MIIRGGDIELTPLCRRTATPIDIFSPNWRIAYRKFTPGYCESIMRIGIIDSGSIFISILLVKGLDRYRRVWNSRKVFR